MRRTRWLVLAAGLAAVAVLGRWRLVPPDPLSVGGSGVRRVDVRLSPSSVNPFPPPGGATEDPGVFADLIGVVRSARETPDHKCAARGAITLERLAGEPVVLQFRPGHHPGWYEFRSGGKVYRVPRGAFVAAVRRVGVELPLTCR